VRVLTRIHSGLGCWANGDVFFEFGLAAGEDRQRWVTVMWLRLTLL
jgi:hypothetical protein